MAHHLEEEASDFEGMLQLSIGVMRVKEPQAVIWNIEEAIEEEEQRRQDEEPVITLVLADYYGKDCSASEQHDDIGEKREFKVEESLGPG